MIRYMINCCVLIGLLFSSLLWADVVLPGKFYIGNNSGDALLPTVMVQQSGGKFIPVAPIHFSLSETLTISEVRLDGAVGLKAGVNIVIWNENSDVLFDKTANNVTPELISSPIVLPAGEYNMAVWGGCFKNGIYQGRYQSNCSDWDDFQFNGIRLVSAGISDSFHFIERTHLGDNSDGSRWYPPSPSGTYVKHLFTLAQKSKLKNLRLFNLRDWGVPNGSRMFIRTQGSVDTPLVFYFSGNGKVNWPIEYELAAGTYELWLETLGRGDLDDISWDDIILRYEPSPQQNDFSAICKQAFPYPAQGRAANHQIDLSGNEWSLMGLIKGTTRGALGYKNSGQIKGTHPQSCDGGRCLPSGNTAILSFPAFPSSWPDSPNIEVPEGTDRQLTSSDGKSFGTISTKNGSSLDIRQAGLTIKTLDLGSGRNGKPYTVRLAAGDYWIKTLKMYDKTLIEVAGPVRLFVENGTMVGESLINSTGSNVRGDIGKLLLVTYETLDMGAQATISGLVYQQDGSAKSALSMGSASYIHGRVSSPKIKVGMNSVIDSSGYSCGGSQNQVDHYELHYGAQTLTCEVANVQLKACANDDCSTLFDLGANVTLSPTQGWSSNPVVVGTSGSAALNLQRYQAGAIPLSIVTATPSAPLRCVKDGVLDANCTISFVDAALRFNVPTFYAGASGVTSIRAIKSNDTGATRVCAPLLTGNQTLQFTSTKVVSEAASNAVPSVNAAAITSSSNASVTFDNDGVGQLTVQYPDAGVLRLDATFQKSDATGTLKLTGSDTFAVLPSAILLSGQNQPACSGTDDASYIKNCGVYRKAGETYNLLAQAINRQGVTTPGFGATNLPLQWATLAPFAGANGMPSPTSFSIADGASSTIAQWDEVGVLKAGVSNFVPYPAYQDESPRLEVPLQWSAPIGRFIPADFNLVSGDIVPACTAFTYMGQPFGVTLDVLARNTTGGQTRNYTGPFAKGSAFLSVANNKDGKSLSSRLRSLPPLPWLDGRAAFTSTSEFVRLSDTRPDGPYSSLLFGLYMRDNDGDRTLIASPNFNDAVVGNCSGSGCNARQIDSVPMKAYFGRLQAGTAAGLASAPLAVPVQMQYYEGGSWLLNKEDKCTQLSLANQGFTFLNPSHSFDAATRDLNLGAGRKIKLGLGASPPGGESAQAKDGEILFHFAKPDISVRIPYKVDLAKQPSQPLWLSDPTSLQGEAIFGSSRGNDRIIYRREVLH
ncbi:DUF6701 domain-containing protein [Aeromonas aquatilis]